MKKKISQKNSDGDVVLRVSVSDLGAAEIEVNPKKWNDPDVWGTLLADVAATISCCYSTKEESKRFVEILEKSFVRDFREAIKQETTE